MARDFVMAKENESDNHPFAIFSGTDCRRLLLHRVDDSLRWDRFVYDVLNGEVVVGRIYFHEKAIGARWFWEISGFDVHDKRVRGATETLHDAKLAFSDSWRELNKHPAE